MSCFARFARVAMNPRSLHSCDGMGRWFVMFADDHLAGIARLTTRCRRFFLCWLSAGARFATDNR